jgi:proteasome lid subunit RPN8/RPN11
MMARIRITAEALTNLRLHAKQGYESSYKKEVGGFLLGEISNKNFMITQSIGYNTRNAGRTYWAPNEETMKRKGTALEKKTGLLWIGTYHSHPEIAGKASIRQSIEDRNSHISSNCLIELIVRIAPVPMHSPKSCLAVQDSETGYYYTICGYIKDGINKISKILVENK